MNLKTLALFVGLVTGVDTVFVQAPACRDGWVRHGSSCYYFSQDLEEWPGAQSICHLFGAQLVIIDDSVEGAFLSNHVRASGLTAWLALTDLMEEGTYQWINNEGLMTPVSYTNWESGQPNDGQGLQNCVIIGHSGRWWDQACTEMRHYICEQLDEQPGIVG